MDIAGVSSALAQVNLQSDIGIAVLGKTMDTSEQMGQGMLKILDAAAMERAANPHIGGNFDVRL